MPRLKIKSRKAREIVDITDNIEKVLSDSDIKNGVGFCFVAHTTAALTTADLDPGTDLDMLDAFDALIPKLKYRHPHDPDHVPEHILATLIGPYVAVPFHNRKLVLGTWQRIVLVEISGPRTREVVVSILAES